MASGALPALGVACIDGPTLRMLLAPLRATPPQPFFWP
jgi:hypothetical protein